MAEKGHRTLARRLFVKSAVVGGAGLVLARPGSVRGAPANSRLNLGLIGAGGRGTHDAGVFISETNTQVVSVADAFQDRLERAKKRLDQRLAAQGRPGIEKSRLYRGLKAYEDLLGSGVDAVLITSPPWYHPEHLEAAVDAGIHVYCEKPVATDVYGAKRVIRAGEKAEGKVSIEVGFQLRSSNVYKEVAERIRRGDIGEPVSGQVYYHTGALGDRSRAGESKDQTRLRNWVFDIALSGDIIVEQNIHCIDIGNWFLGSHPVRAIGTGGQKARTGLGDCYDHFQVLYTYPNDVQIAFTSTQFLKGWGDVAVRIYGSKGVAEIHYDEPNRITGAQAWETKDDPFSGVESRRVSGFVKSIFEGKPINSARHGGESALSSMLGREATYKGRELTWDELMRSNQRYRVELKIS